MPEHPSQPSSARYAVWHTALCVMAGITLFPLAWLGELFPALGYWIDLIFATELAHIIGHSIMFGMLGALVLIVLPPLRTRLGLYIGLLLLGVVGQEAFQLLYKQRGLASDDLRDMLVDLLALLVVWGAVRGWAWWRGQASLPQT